MLGQDDWVHVPRSGSEPPRQFVPFLGDRPQGASSSLNRANSCGREGVSVLPSLVRVNILEACRVSAPPSVGETSKGIPPNATAAAEGAPVDFELERRVAREGHKAATADGSREGGSGDDKRVEGFCSMGLDREAVMLGVACVGEDDDKQAEGHGLPAGGHLRRAAALRERPGAGRDPPRLPHVGGRALFFQQPPLAPHRADTARHGAEQDGSRSRLSEERKRTEKGAGAGAGAGAKPLNHRHVSESR
eukprot:scaffold1486_cov329-Prasinococcus_capsulatus_cf.AAC.5